MSWVALAQQGSAFARDTPQHGVHETLEMREVDLFDHPHRGVDGGMGRRAQKQQLGRAQPQHVDGRNAGVVDRAFDQLAQHAVDFAQPTQGRGQQQPDKGAVARNQRGKALVTAERIVEGLAPVEAGAQQFERGAAGSERNRVGRSGHGAAL